MWNKIKRFYILFKGRFFHFLIILQRNQVTGATSRNKRASINEVYFINPAPTRGELEARRETAVDLGVEDVMTNQLIGPRVSGQAGGRKVASSRVETNRVGSAAAPTGYKSPLALWRRRHTSLALWTVRNSVARATC